MSRWDEAREEKARLYARGLEGVEAGRWGRRLDELQHERDEDLFASYLAWVESLPVIEPRPESIDRCS